MKKILKMQVMYLQQHSLLECHMTKNQKIMKVVELS